tara:strand:+ start:2515 stop:2874 length:360 start_codon:yes stop_codon:yes gene_type:complete
MKELRTIVKEAISLIEDQVISIEALMTSTSDRNISDILTEIRGLRGVTIVSTLIPSIARGEGRNVSSIKIKYIPLEGEPPKKYLTELHRELINMDNILKVKFKDFYKKKKKYMQPGGIM